MKKVTHMGPSAFTAAMADLFMNFALALTWVLFIAPQAPLDDSIPQESQPPTERNPGDRPAAGREIARVTVGAQGQATIESGGEQLTLEEFLTHLQEHPEKAPDHFVFRFPEFEEFQELAKDALHRDASVSLELRR